MIGRRDGMCPRCVAAQKAPGYSYCMPCRRNYQRECYARKCKSRPDMPADLNVQQRRDQVLKMLADGLTDKRIMAGLNITGSTLKNDKDWWRRYSATKTTVQMAVWAAKSGLV